jgi:hypothetical protein
VYPFTAITVYPSGISGALKYPIFRVVSKSTVGSILIIFNSNLPFTEKINYRKQLDATQNAT